MISLFLARDSQGNRIVDQKQVLKIWENYVTELYDRSNRPETLEVEPEEEVDTDEKGPYILQSEQERDVLMTQIKELQQELQSVKVSVCCLHLALHYYWDLLLLTCHRTL